MHARGESTSAGRSDVTGFRRINWLAMVPAKPLGGVGAYVDATIWIVAALLFARLAVAPVLGDFDSPFVTVSPAVLIVTLRHGAWPGLYALALGLLAVDFLFVPPRFTLRILSAPDARMMVAFAASGVLEWAVAALLRASVTEIRARQAELEAQSAQRAAVASELETVVHELGHRVRNLLQLVAGISIRIAASATSVKDYRDALARRLKALGDVQGLVMRPGGGPLDLRSVLELTLAPFKGDSAIQLDGPPVEVPSELGVPICLVLHELATNAMKYGALSTPEGVVRIAWTVPDGRVLHLSWIEEGGPQVVAPEGKGFGTSLLEGLLCNYGGQGVMRHEPGGLVFTMTLPLSP
jgi:two-component sensor histidine kinase